MATDEEDIYEAVETVKQHLKSVNQGDRLQEIWRIHLQTFIGRSNIHPEQVIQFWEYVGVCGQNGEFDPQDFERVGLLDYALAQIEHETDQVDEDEQVEDFLPELVKFLKDEWPDKTGDILAPGNTVRAGVGSISGSISTS